MENKFYITLDHHECCNGGWVNNNVPGSIEVTEEEFEDLTNNDVQYINGERVPVPPELRAQWDAEDMSPEHKRYLAMLEGVEFEGVMCSAVKDDMWGLAAIKPWIAEGNSVGFKFRNGNTLQLTSTNLDAFEAVWVPFRASFF